MSTSVKEMMFDWTPNRIRELLRKKGWATSDLVGALGCSQAAVYSWLRGDAKPLWTFQRRMNAWAIELGMKPEEAAGVTEPG